MQYDWADLNLFISALGNSVNHSVVVDLIDHYDLNRDDNYDQAYYENESYGIALSCDNEKIEAIFLFSEGRDGFSQYVGPLVNDLSFGASKEEVIKSMGAPSEMGEPQKGTPSTTHGGWLRYDFAEFSIHFSFRADKNEMDLVTLMPK